MDETGRRSDVIEITPEMIEAGRRLYELLAAASDEGSYIGAYDDSGSIVDGYVNFVELAAAIRRAEAVC